MKKIIVLAVFSFFLVVGVGGCKKEELTPTVYYSDWIQINLSNESAKTILVPQITQEILDKGIVLVYYGSSDKSVNALLPYPGIGAESPMQADIYLTKIYIRTQQKFNSFFRYVIIPGQANVKTMGMNYNEIKELYNITD